MSQNDLMSDFVARVNNARLAKKPELEVLRNNMIVDTCNKLTKLGYFKEYKESEDKRVVNVVVDLDRVNYIKRVSKPGQRVYTEATKFPRITGGVGFNILTTSKGVLTHIEARDQKLGGEVLFQIY